MRSIKFRAWDGKNFVTEDFYVMDGQAYTLEDDGGCSDPDCCGGANYFMQDKKWKLQQFTGLHDKNGKEIYEGDIVAISVNSKEELCDDGSGIGTVVWDEKKFTWTWKYNLEICPWNKNVVEWAEKSLIIGNIYENPELLKV